MSGFLAYLSHGARKENIINNSSGGRCGAMQGRDSNIITPTTTRIVSLSFSVVDKETQNIYRERLQLGALYYQLSLTV